MRFTGCGAWDSRGAPRPHRAAGAPCSHLFWGVPLLGPRGQAAWSPRLLQLTLCLPQDGVMVLSATHRYKKKYVTTLLYKPI